MDARQQQEMMLAVDKKGEELDAVIKAWVDANRGVVATLGEGRELTLRARHDVGLTTSAASRNEPGTFALMTEAAQPRISSSYRAAICGRSTVRQPIA